MSLSNLSYTPTILLFEPDDDARPLLTQYLRDKGYQVLVSVDSEDALQRASGSLQIDLILINQVNRTIDSYIELGQRIRQNYYSAHIANGRIPVVIMAEDYQEDLEGKNLQINDDNYVVYLADGQQLFDFLQTFFL